MNFNWAMKQLEAGKKVCRPNWQKGSYWKLGVHARICWADGLTAHVHLPQIREKDWELFKEEEKPKVIILDNNELSIMKYAEEFPENWKNICKAIEEKENKR